jgi:hypothetical protein
MFEKIIGGHPEINRYLVEGSLLFFQIQEADLCYETRPPTQSKALCTNASKHRGKRP